MSDQRMCQSIEELNALSRISAWDSVHEQVNAKIPPNVFGWVPSALRGVDRREAASHWFATHYRTRAAEIGVQAAARQMRKQGVPIEVAVSILATR